ncbi:MAG: hypothetical protein LBT59_17965, partial [Clostridiales bacterium]|nr:hypothetical protein [Clostridiales bacterium]
MLQRMQTCNRRETSNVTGAKLLAKLLAAMRAAFLGICLSLSPLALTEALADTKEQEHNMSYTLTFETDGLGRQETFVMKNDSAATGALSQWFNYHFLTDPSGRNVANSSSYTGFGFNLEALYPSSDFKSESLDARRLVGKVVNVEIKNRTGRETPIGAMPIVKAVSPDSAWAEGKALDNRPPDEFSNEPIGPRLGEGTNLADVLYLTVVINKINNESKNIVVA